MFKLFYYLPTILSHLLLVPGTRIWRWINIWIFWIFLYSGHIPDFRCKFLGDDDSYTNTNTKLNNSRNVTFQFNQCDVTVTTNLSGTVVKEIVPCRAEYEFSGQQTVASEVSGDSRFKSGVRLQTTTCFVSRDFINISII